MTPVTEQEVAVAASFMGYDLWRGPDCYLLKREWHSEQEIIEASSLELIAEFLAHWPEMQKPPDAMAAPAGWAVARFRGNSSPSVNRRGIYNVRTRCRASSSGMCLIVVSIRAGRLPLVAEA
jgi:hypothetical protein